MEKIFKTLFVIVIIVNNLVSRVFLRLRNGKDYYPGIDDLDISTNLWKLD